MAAHEQSISWTFGGALAGQPPVVAWAVLGGAAIVGVGFVWWSYRHALVEIVPGRRVLLCPLRCLPWLGILAILAVPTRVHRVYEQPPGERALAVLVDHSASMTTPDNRQRRRLDDAMRRWREMAPAMRKAHAEVKTFAFADGVAPAALDELPAKIGTDQTRMFTALQNVLDEAPPGGWAGVVTLTDGLDTSGTPLTDGMDATAR